MIQKVAERLGENGCYFFSLFYLAEKITKRHLNSLDAYLEMLAKGYIQQDCFILAPDKILSNLTGDNWQVSKSPASYICRPSELEILYFENKTTLKTYGHFVVGNGLGSVEFDPYGDSNTVKNGKLLSKRIFWKV